FSENRFHFSGSCSRGGVGRSACHLPGAWCTANAAQQDTCYKNKCAGRVPDTTGASLSLVFAAITSGPAELFFVLIGQLAIALEDNVNPGIFQGEGAQPKQKLGCRLVVSARDLKAASPGLLGDDGKRNAQRRLPKLVLGIELSALTGQVFNDIIQCLVG